MLSMASSPLLYDSSDLDNPLVSREVIGIGGGFFLESY